MHSWHNEKKSLVKEEILLNKNVILLDFFFIVINLEKTKLLHLYLKKKCIHQFKVMWYYQHSKHARNKIIIKTGNDSIPCKPSRHACHGPEDSLNIWSFHFFHDKARLISDKAIKFSHKMQCDVTKTKYLWIIINSWYLQKLFTLKCFWKPSGKWWLRCVHLHVHSWCMKETLTTFNFDF